MVSALVDEASHCDPSCDLCQILDAHKFLDVVIDDELATLGPLHQKSIVVALVFIWIVTGVKRQ